MNQKFIWSFIYLFFNMSMRGTWEIWISLILYSQVSLQYSFSYGLVQNETKAFHSEAKVLTDTILLYRPE